jgi:hypothetical protein
VLSGSRSGRSGGRQATLERLIITVTITDTVSLVVVANAVVVRFRVAPAFCVRTVGARGN